MAPIGLWSHSLLLSNFMTLILSILFPTNMILDLLLADDLHVVYWLTNKNGNGHHQQKISIKFINDRLSFVVFYYEVM